MSKTTAFSVNLYHSLYELSQTDMYLSEGFEMEKYRQHHKYHSVFSANSEQACITMAETHFELYHLRHYLTALGLRTSLDDTPFSEKTLIAATMKCECTPVTPTVNGCLNGGSGLAQQPASAARRRQGDEYKPPEMKRNRPTFIY